MKDQIVVMIAFLLSVLFGLVFIIYWYRTGIVVNDLFIFSLLFHIIGRVYELPKDD